MRRNFFICPLLHEIFATVIRDSLSTFATEHETVAVADAAIIICHPSKYASYSFLRSDSSDLAVSIVTPIWAFDSSVNGTLLPLHFYNADPLLIFSGLSFNIFHLDHCSMTDFYSNVILFFGGRISDVATEATTHTVMETKPSESLTSGISSEFSFADLRSTPLNSVTISLFVNSFYQAAVEGDLQLMRVRDEREYFVLQKDATRTVSYSWLDACIAQRIKLPEYYYYTPSKELPKQHHRSVTNKSKSDYAERKNKSRPLQGMNLVVSKRVPAAKRKHLEEAAVWLGATILTSIAEAPSDNAYRAPAGGLIIVVADTCSEFERKSSCACVSSYFMSKLLRVEEELHSPLGAILKGTWAQSDPLQRYLSILYYPPKNVGVRGVSGDGLSGIAGLRGSIFAVSGFGEEGADPGNLDVLAGIRLVGGYTASCMVEGLTTYLLCRRMTGEKYNVAKKWGESKIRVVHWKWLLQCLLEWSAVDPFEDNRDVDIPMEDTLVEREIAVENTGIEIVTEIGIAIIEEVGEMVGEVVEEEVAQEVAESCEEVRPISVGEAVAIVSNKIVSGQIVSKEGVPNQVVLRPKGEEEQGGIKGPFLARWEEDKAQHSQGYFNFYASQASQATDTDRELCCQVACKPSPGPPQYGATNQKDYNDDLINQDRDRIEYNDNRVKEDNDLINDNGGLMNRDDDRIDCDDNRTTDGAVEAEIEVEVEVIGGGVEVKTSGEVAAVEVVEEVEKVGKVDEVDWLVVVRGRMEVQVTEDISELVVMAVIEVVGEAEDLQVLEEVGVVEEVNLEAIGTLVGPEETKAEEVEEEKEVIGDSVIEVGEKAGRRSEAGEVKILVEQLEVKEIEETEIEEREVEQMGNVRGTIEVRIISELPVPEVVCLITAVEQAGQVVITQTDHLVELIPAVEPAVPALGNIRKKTTKKSAFRFLFGGGSEEQVAEARATVKALGGSVVWPVVSRYDETCTHLILWEVKRTEKYLCACAAGRWILRPEYLAACVADMAERSSSFPAEEPYEWGDEAISSSTTLSENQIIWAKAGKRWRLAAHGQDVRTEEFKRPFSSMVALIFGSTLPPAETLNRMVISGGGKAIIITHALSHLLIGLRGMPIERDTTAAMGIEQRIVGEKEKRRSKGRGRRSSVTADDVSAGDIQDLHDEAYAFPPCLSFFLGATVVIASPPSDTTQMDQLSFFSLLDSAGVTALQRTPSYLLDRLCEAPSVDDMTSTGVGTICS